MIYSDPFIYSDKEREYEFTHYYFYENLFSEEECNEIIRLGEESNLFEGRVGGGVNDLRTTVRKSEIGFMEYEPDNQWIFDKIASSVIEANEVMWGFDVWGFGDGLQYTKYYEDGGHYDWHADVGPTVANRKISFVLQLSEPEDYDGGLLQLNVGHQFLEVPRAKGNVAIFPSYLLHRVTPVVAGERKSLVAWVSGPTFR
jgi:PKHD-type hydroxylase